MLLVLRLSPKGPFLLLFYFLEWESRSLYKGQKSLSERIGADIGFQVNREIINFPGFHQEKSYQTDKCSDLRFLLHAKRRDFLSDRTYSSLYKHVKGWWNTSWIEVQGNILFRTLKSIKIYSSLVSENSEVEVSGLPRVASFCTYRRCFIPLEPELGQSAD